MRGIYTTMAALLLAAPAYATPYNRPIPQAQSATAELWFSLASLALIVALGVVNWLVRHR